VCDRRVETRHAWFLLFLIGTEGLASLASFPRSSTTAIKLSYGVQSAALSTLAITKLRFVLHCEFVLNLMALTLQHTPSSQEGTLKLTQITRATSPLWRGWGVLLHSRVGTIVRNIST